MDEPSNHAAFGERREAALRSDRKAGNGTGVRVRFHEERRHLPRSRLSPQRDKTPGAIKGGRLFPTVGIDEYGIAGPTVWQHAVGIRGLKRTTRWPFRRRAVWPSLGGAAASGRTHKVGGSLPLLSSPYRLVLGHGSVRAVDANAAGPERQRVSPRGVDRFISGIGGAEHR